MLMPRGAEKPRAAYKSDRVPVGTYHRLQNALEQSVEPSSPRISHCCVFVVILTRPSMTSG
jgi:hypothetical protein